MNKKEDLTKKAIEFYNSAACYFAEGVEFMSKEQIYDALKKEFDGNHSTIWFPIETAPKNKRILIYSPIAGIFSGCFDCNTYYSAISPTHWTGLPPEPEV
jgi:hypothetical protein